MAIIELAAANFLTFTDSANSNIKWQKVEHRLTFGEALKRNMFAEHVQSHLWFQHVASLTKVLHLNAGNVLSFSAITVPRALMVTAESGLPIAHWAEVYFNHPAVSQLHLTQTVAFDISKYNLQDTFLLSHSVELKVVKVYQLAHTLMLSHGVAVYKENKNYIGPHPDV